MGAPAVIARAESPGPAASPEPAGGRRRPASAIYEGWVFHAREAPVRHAFRYRIFMPLFDLAELPGLLDPIPLWSARRRAPARLPARRLPRRPRQLPLAEAARDLVAGPARRRPAGPVLLLANPRYWGIGMNPVSFYYLHGDGPVSRSRR